MQQWRKEHPKATLKEIEQALDQQMGRLRVNMLQNLLTASATTTEELSPCPNCAKPLQKRGKKTVN